MRTRQRLVGGCRRRGRSAVHSAGWQRAAAGALARFTSCMSWPRTLEDAPQQLGPLCRVVHHLQRASLLHSQLEVVQSEAVFTMSSAAAAARASSPGSIPVPPWCCTCTRGCAKE
jgi:hypothetical protein